MTRSATSDAAARSGSPPQPGLRFPRAARLRRSRDIRRLQRRGRRLTGPYIDVRWLPSPSGRPRLGIVVPRYGHTAVERNRVRRRLREIARTEWLPAFLSESHSPDVLFRAKPSAYGVSYERLRESLTEPLETLCASSS